MSKLFRFGVSIEKDLIDKFDNLIQKQNYNNRSEAIRDLIRKELVNDHWTDEGEIAGAITIIYDHHQRLLSNKLVDLQHDFHHIIISTQHIHLDHSNCLEILAVRGNAGEVYEVANLLKSQKGVKHCTLSMSTTGREL